MAGESDLDEGTSAAQAAVLQPSEKLDSTYPIVKGPNLEEEQTLGSLLSSFSTIGFQASGVAKACEIIEKMRKWRLSDEAIVEDENEEFKDDRVRKETGATIFLGFTSNLISSGLREVLVFLVKHKFVSAIVTTAGGIEEDLIKCMGTTHLGKFHLDGADLRKRGLNRIGNLLVPNDNYCKFEDWVMPRLEKMRQEQGDDDVFKAWSPSKVCERLGQEIDNESSFLYWAAKNQIPVFCPALTDGSLGDMLYFHSYKSPGLVIDLVQDIRKLNDLSVKAKKAGMIILGGGVCKHQIANAMLFRNGADYAVYINTGQEFDGSDSGARPDEAVSWGKIKSHERGGESVKVYCDATIIFPFIVANTFAKAYWAEKKSQKSS